MGQAQFYPNCVAVPRGPGPGPSAPRGVRAAGAFSSHWFGYLAGIAQLFVPEAERFRALSVWHILLWILGLWFLLWLLSFS
jgi:hypothetical protein